MLKREFNNKVDSNAGMGIINYGGFFLYYFRFL